MMHQKIRNGVGLPCPEMIPSDVKSRNRGGGGVMGNSVGSWPFGWLLAPSCQLWQQLSFSGSRVL